MRRPRSTEPLITLSAQFRVAVVEPEHRAHDAVQHAVGEDVEEGGLLPLAEAGHAVEALLLGERQQAQAVGEVELAVAVDGRDPRAARRVDRRRERAAVAAVLPEG